jgi:hypothetical protein
LLSISSRRGFLRFVLQQMPASVSEEDGRLEVIVEEARVQAASRRLKTNRTKANRTLRQRDPRGSGGSGRHRPDRAAKRRRSAEGVPSIGPGVIRGRTRAAPRDSPPSACGGQPKRMVLYSNRRARSGGAAIPAAGKPNSLITASTARQAAANATGGPCRERSFDRPVSTRLTCPGVRLCSGCGRTWGTPSRRFPGGLRGPF